MPESLSNDESSGSDRDQRGDSTYDDEPGTGVDVQLTPDSRLCHGSQPDENARRDADVSAGHNRCIIQNIQQATEYADVWPRSLSYNSKLVRDTTFISLRGISHKCRRWTSLNGDGIFVGAVSISIQETTFSVVSERRRLAFTLLRCPIDH